MSVWEPKDKLPAAAAESAGRRKKEAKRDTGRLSVVLLHGFAGDGIFTWTLQVAHAPSIDQLIHLSLLLQFSLLQNKMLAGRCTRQALRRVRPGPALLRRLDVVDAAGRRRPPPFPRVPGGVRGAVRGGRVQLRRLRGVPVGGGSPGPGRVGRLHGLARGHVPLHRRGRGGSAPRRSPSSSSPATPRGSGRSCPRAPTGNGGSRILSSRTISSWHVSQDDKN
ncbi:hypothetical protein SEVIR_2G203301v4 [Setaria viridis]